MVRGGHLDVAILGAFQVAESGDLAYWSTGPKGLPAVGGAMDLAHGAKRAAVITDHVTKEGERKLLDRCTMPLTGVACVTRVYTSLAVVDVEDGRFVLARNFLGFPWRSCNLSLERVCILTAVSLTSSSRSFENARGLYSRLCSQADRPLRRDARFHARLGIGQGVAIAVERA
jgi:3-oxoacid CoA-transferase B subunit